MPFLTPLRISHTFIGSAAKKPTNMAVCIINQNVHDIFDNPVSRNSTQITTSWW